MPRIIHCVGFVLVFSGIAFAEPPNRDIAATVNGETIRLAQIDAFIKTKLAVIPVTDSQLRQLRTEVVSDLIDDLVLKQFLAKNAPRVEAGEIDKQLEAFTESLTKKGKTLAGFLKETNQTEAELRETWTATQQLDAHVKQMITEEQLKQYYSANKDYFDRVEVKASHIMARVSPKAAATEKAGAKEKLQAIRVMILAGKLDFAKAAKKHSQCPSASMGGDLGFMPRKSGLMDEAFCKAAFALKPGDISDVVESEFGLHLILVAERKPGKPSEFEKCVDEVRDAYTDEYRLELIAKLRKEAQVLITLP